MQSFLSLDIFNAYFKTWAEFERLRTNVLFASLSKEATVTDLAEQAESCLHFRYLYLQIHSRAICRFCFNSCDEN